MTRVLSGQLSVVIATPTHTGLSSARLRETTASAATAGNPAAMHVDCPPPCQFGAGFDVPPYAEATKHPIMVPHAIGDSKRPDTRPNTSSTTVSTAPTTTSRRTSRLPRKSGTSNRHGPRYVTLACGACKKAHLACDPTRPCRRCCSLDKGDQCRDEPHKPRGRRRFVDRALSSEPVSASDVAISKTAATESNLPEMGDQDNSCALAGSLNTSTAELSGTSNTATPHNSISAPEPTPPLPDLFEIFTSPNLKIIRATPSSAALTGLHPHEFINLPFIEFLHPSDRHMVDMYRLSLFPPHVFHTSPMMWRETERAMVELPIRDLLSPAPGPQGYPNLNARVLRADSTYEWFNVRMHVGGGLGADLTRGETLDRAYVVISLLLLNRPDRFGGGSPANLLESTSKREREREIPSGPVTWARGCSTEREMHLGGERNAADFPAPYPSFPSAMNYLWPDGGHVGEPFFAPQSGYNPGFQQFNFRPPHPAYPFHPQPGHQSYFPHYTNPSQLSQTTHHQQTPASQDCTRPRGSSVNGPRSPLALHDSDQSPLFPPPLEHNTYEAHRTPWPKIYNQSWNLHPQYGKPIDPLAPTPDKTAVTHGQPITLDPRSPSVIDQHPHSPNELAEDGKFIQNLAMKPPHPMYYPDAHSVGNQGEWYDHLGGVSHARRA